MTRKASITVVLASLLALPLVRAQSTFPTLFDPIFDLFGPGGLAGLYTPETALFWDSILALMIFVSLAQFALKDRFGGKAIPIALGIALSVGYIGFEVATGFRLSELAPLAVLIIFGLLVFLFFTFLERFIKNKFLAGLLAFAIVFALLPPQVIDFLSQYVIFDWIIFFYTLGLLVLIIWVPIALFRFLGAGAFGGSSGSVFGGGGVKNNPIYRDADKNEREDIGLLSRLRGQKEANPQAAEQARERALAQLDDLGSQELQTEQDLAEIARTLEERLNSLRAYQINMNNYFQSVGEASLAAEQMSGEYVEKLSQSLSEADKELQALMLAHEESAGLINKEFETGFANAELKSSTIWNKTRSSDITQRALGRLSARLQAHTGLFSKDTKKLVELLEMITGETLQESMLLDDYRLMQLHDETIKSSVKVLSQRAQKIRKLRGETNKVIALLREAFGISKVKEDAITAGAIEDFVGVVSSRKEMMGNIPAALNTYNKLMEPMKQHVIAMQESLEKARKTDKELVKAFTSITTPLSIRRDLPSLKRAPKNLHEYLRLYGETLVHFVRTASKFAMLDRMSAFLIERVRTIYQLHQVRLQLSEHIVNHTQSIKNMRTEAGNRVSGLVEQFKNDVEQAILDDAVISAGVKTLALFSEIELSAIQNSQKLIKPRETNADIHKQAIEFEVRIQNIRNKFLADWVKIEAELRRLNHKKMAFLEQRKNELDQFLQDVEQGWTNTKNATAGRP